MIAMVATHVSARAGRALDISGRVVANDHDIYLPG